MEGTEKFIAPKPKLRYIEKTLSLLEPETDHEGKELNWLNLHERVGEWGDGLELSNEVRKVVQEYLFFKIPNLKEKIPSIGSLPDRELMEALSNGWFDDLNDEETISGQRREVLLAVAAHIVHRIETRIYKKIFEGSASEDLQKLGFPEEMQEAMVEIMDASAKADPLFIRFLAYSQLADKPEDPIAVAPLGQDNKPHTFAELFPHETQYISNRFAEVIRGSSRWEHLPNAQLFKEYLGSLSSFFAEKDIGRAKHLLYEDVTPLYEKVLASGFPIIIIPPDYQGGYAMEPYIEPELRVAIRTPESSAQENKFIPIKEAISSELGELGVGEFADEMRSKVIRSYISLGPYGAGLTMNAVAQTDPGIVMYYNEQLRAYDADLKKFLSLIEGFETIFHGVGEARIEEMSREDTIMHEVSHAVYPTRTKEAQRFGSEMEVIISEASAESIARGLAGSLIEKNKIYYTPEQYAATAICMPLQVLGSSTPDDEYYKAAVFVLNGLFEKGILGFENKKIKIKSHADLLAYFKSNAQVVIGLYRDEGMSEEKAKKWVFEHCRAGEKLQEVIEYVKSIGADS